ncbi:MAG: hypothetical protein H6Q91_3093, partial [Deltaproteobacteria bacterium]|nr:hypothetical protein [Deltaproteobacteria bacterium]
MTIATDLGNLLPRVAFSLGAVVWNRRILSGSRAPAT